MRKAIKNISKYTLAALLLCNQVQAQLPPVKPNVAINTQPIPASQVIPKPSAYISGVYVNYVRTKEAKAPIQALTDFEVFDNTKMTQATQYLDGLGRPIQTVVKQGSVNSRDIVSYNVYDEFGREAVKYLPYEELATLSTINNTGDFKLNPFNSQQLFNEAQYSGEQVFYSKTVFEASPLNRPLQTMAAGNSWAGSGRGVSVGYEINDANEVRIWDIDAITQKPTTATTYNAGELYRTITTDEHGKKVVEYKDKEGKVILKKVQIGDAPAITAHADWLSTYYIYDDFGLLRWVLQPKMVEYLNTHNWTFPTGTAGQTMLDELTFRYTYDERNRMIVKKVPGAGAVYMVYDQRDRLVLTQDAKMRTNSQWLATKYDALNRPIQTYLWSSPETHDVQRASAANSIDYPSAGTLSSAIMLTETYYDNYNWDPTTVGLNTYDPSLLQSSNYYTATTAAPLYAMPLSATQNTNTLGLVTGTKVRVLGSTTGNDYIYTVSYYDDKNRVIQTQATQYGGGTMATTSQYDFSGKVLVSIAHHTRPGKSDMDITSVMTYDAGGRLQKLEKDINGQGLKKITENVYTALGQLKNKKLGKDIIEDKPVEAQDYTYNIRGWLTGINRGLANPLYNTENNDQKERWFGMQLCYDYGFDNGSVNNDMFNGNISGQIWVSKNSGKQRAYGYTYDAANRLMFADFNSNTAATGSAAVWNKTDGYDFTVTMGNGTNPTSAYDANGNIKAMKQMGYTNGSSTAIDILTYSYQQNSNKLQNVIDDGISQQPTGLNANNQNEMLGDFRYSKTYGSKPDGDLDYQYDENGNMIFDDHKDIASIEYNHLNLPQRIVITGKGTIYYTYDATGNKLQKVVEDNTQTPAIVTTTNYVNGFVYEEKTPTPAGTAAGEQLQFFNHEEGRFRPSSAVVTVPGAAPPTQWVADFFIKDHLGNVRMSLTEETSVTDHMLATLEYPHLNDESLYFEKLIPAVKPPGFDDDPNNSNVNNLEGISGSTSMGMGILVKVNAGDRIKTGVFAHYSDLEIPGTPPTTQDMANQLVMGINAGFANLMGQKGLELISSATPANLTGVLNFLNNQNNQTPNGDGVLANLNWMMLDNDLVLQEGGSGYQQVPGQDVELGKVLIQAEEGEDIIAQRSGYLYIFVNNKGGVPVQFDDLFVIRKKSAFLEETHYYPFGLTMNGISSKAEANLNNKYKYNGNEEQREEFSDGSGLEWLDFNARTYNAQIGRFMQVDPLSEDAGQESWSVYHSDFNNPVSNVDPEGTNPRAIITAGRLLYRAISVYNGGTTSNTGAFVLNEVSSIGRDFATLTSGAKVISGMDKLRAGIDLFFGTDLVDIGGGYSDAEKITLSQGIEMFGFAKVLAASALDHEATELEGEIKQLNKELKGQEKALRQHEEKLKEYKEDPQGNDNKGMLKDGRSHVDEKIAGRAAFLEKTIKRVKEHIKGVTEKINNTKEKLKEVNKKIDNL